MNSSRISRRRAAAAGLALLTALVSGCGSKGTTRVSGKVAAYGKPVTAGSLVFAPVVAQGAEGVAPATTEVKSDGTFTADKVPTGKVRVLYNAPPGEYPPGHTPKPSEPPVQSPFNGMVVKQPEVEFKDGATIDVELAVPGKR